MSKRKFTGNIGAKGYYIALILCALAIGISGYLYYRNANDQEPSLQDPVTNVDATVSQEPNVQAIAPQPGSTPTEPTGGAQSTQPSPSGKLKTSAPVAGEAISGYAMETLSYNQTTRDWRVHDGIDYAAAAGTAVTAAADGTVYTVFEDDTMGTTVVIRHEGGYITKYASLAQEVSVAPGDAVKLGQTIGQVGTTALLESAIGEHVHFSVTCDGATVDPQSFLTQE